MTPSVALHKTRPDRTGGQAFACRLLCGLLFLMALPAQAELDREDKIRAAYLYNLSKFIEWPVDSRLAASSHFNLCIKSSLPFFRYMQTLDGKKSRGRQLQILSLNEHPDSPCHIAYIESNNYSKESIQDYYQRSAITVGNGNEFLRRGGTIALIVTRNHMQLNIKYQRVKALGINMSANLLEVATIVQ